MRSGFLGVLILFFLVGLSSNAVPKEKQDGAKRFASERFDEQYALRESADPDYVSSSVVDTFTIVYYDFETANWQGWTRLDLTAQLDTFWHVEDYLEPELAGLPGPLDGAKSAWCGAPPGPYEYICHWMNAPGYGNMWDQSLVTDPLYFHGYLDISYRLYVDCEVGYDYLRVEYDAGGSNWQEVVSYTGTVNTTGQERVVVPMPKTKLRFHFVSDGAVSDEDGGINTNGAAHVDDITVADAGGTLNFEDFESAPDRAHRAGIWHAEVAPGYGMYSGLMAGLRDRDECDDDFSTMVAFFIGSDVPDAYYPGLYDTPFCKGPGGKKWPCQDELVVSPIIDLTKYSTGRNSVQDAEIPAEDLSLLGGTLLRYSIYVDLPASNCVYDQWVVRPIASSGCPGLWQGLNYWREYFGAGYIFPAWSIGRFLGAADSMQIALGVFDYCYAWGTTSCMCRDHTPSPWYDNVRVVRYKSVGPQWTYRDLELFQDNFPGNEWDVESYVRADMADDINLASNPAIRPGDSVVVTVGSPLGGGIAHDADGGPAVYMHARCTYVGCGDAPPKAAYIDGMDLQGTYGVWKSVDGGHWNVFRCDSARYQGFPTPDLYCCDLNDSLFTRGYVIDYYFTANDNVGNGTALPRWCRSTGPYWEFTCLPTKCSDVLFVDDFQGRGSFAGSVESYWDPVFSAVLPWNPSSSTYYLLNFHKVDRYDVNAPSSGVDNGPGSRAKNAQLTGVSQGNWLGYDNIIWDSGDLMSFTITNGWDDKSNDVDMLINWLNLSPHRVGLWVCGDDIANGLKTLGRANGLALLQQWCGVDVDNNSYFEKTGGRTGGGVTTPLITGALAPDLNLYQDAGVAYKWYAFGGCPIINSFDVLKKVGTGKVAATYPVYNATQQPAAIGNVRLNSSQDTVSTMWFGFSYMFVRDDTLQESIDRFMIAKKTFMWMRHVIQPPPILESEIPAAYKLAQNYPNPFNPSTTIKFDMRTKGLVTLKIYNAAGQLVRTLVDGVRDAGSYSVPWDGKNNLGSALGSGIYFYKMETKGFSATRKLVLLR